MAKPHHFGAILRIPTNLQMFHSEGRQKTQNGRKKKKKTEDMKGKEAGSEKRGWKRRKGGKKDSIYSK